MVRPHTHISYNETVLKHLQGQPQVRTLNNVSIPLPIGSSSEDTDLDTSETDEESEQFTFNNHSLQDHPFVQALN